MTDTTSDDDGVLKVDSLGWVQTPPERREALLDEFERSGMSGQAFAERYGIKYQTFCSWRQARRKAGKKGEAEGFTLALAELPKVDPAMARGPLSIELAGGHRLAVEDQRGVALAAALIRELAQG